MGYTTAIGGLGNRYPSYTGSGSSSGGTTSFWKDSRTGKIRISNAAPPTSAAGQAEQEAMRQQYYADTGIWIAPPGGGSYAQYAQQHNLSTGTDSTTQTTGATGLTPGQEANSIEAQKMQEAIDRANREAEQQRLALQTATTAYQDLVTKYDARDEELTTLMDGMGDEERRRIEQTRSKLKAELKDDARKRGITSTTGLDALTRGVDGMTEESLQNLMGQLQEKKLAYKSAFSGDTLQAQKEAIGLMTAATQANFAGGQAVSGTIQEMAKMFSEQRMAGWSNQTQLQQHLATTGQQKYAADLGYKAQLYGLQQREDESMRQTGLAREQGLNETNLGYAGLQNQYNIAQQQKGSLTQVQASRDYFQQQLGYGGGAVATQMPTNISYKKYI